MSSMLSPHGVAVATAMAVSAGTVILLAFRLQRIDHNHPISLRSCISNDGNGGQSKKKKKKKKRVHFAEDVVEPKGDGEEFRKQLKTKNNNNKDNALKKGVKNRGVMPENRAALYNGILRDRDLHRSVNYSC